MDKPWIKRVLIGSFLVSLAMVFLSTAAVLSPGAPAPFLVPLRRPIPPMKPAFGTIDHSKPDDAKRQLESMAAQVVEYGHAVKAYETEVTAYARDMEARANAWKLEHGDPGARRDAYTVAIKDTLGPLIVTPLLGALIVYAGIKVAGDAAVARAAKKSDIASP